MLKSMEKDAVRHKNSGPTKVPLGEVIRLQHHGLIERNGEYIAQGWLAFESLRDLKKDSYQRAVLCTGPRRGRLEVAVANGKTLAAIVLGMRGQNYSIDNGDMLLENPIYIIDGLQRVSAVKAHGEKNPDVAHLLGIHCEIRFNTSRETEKELFHILNVVRDKLSSNVILRNAKEDNLAIATLHGLSTIKTSPLCEKVCWEQDSTRGELMTGILFAKLAETIHRHVEVSVSRSKEKDVGSKKGIERSMDLLERRAAGIGLETFRRNMLEFINIVDEVWGIRNVEYRQRATQLKGNFLMMLARLFSDHTNFWKGERLVVPTDFKKKLKSFKMTDPHVQQLAGAGSTAIPVIYVLMESHLNKGKRENRLKQREVLASSRLMNMKEAA